ncbi:MAG: hypothetical protein HC904_03185 [Blastochloris sp.]|nr:hypothetical protein [Blastochloris sp.]
MRRLMIGWVFLGWSILTALGQENVKEVTVCFWNVQNFGVTDRFIEGRPQKAAMKPDSEIKSMVAILGRIKPDILGVCEILQAPEDEYVKLFIKTLKDAGLDYPHQATVVGEDKRIQTLFLSRFPFASVEPLNTETFEASQTDAKTKVVTKLQLKVGRGINNVVIQVTPEFRMRTMMVHLKSKRPYPELDQSNPGEPGDSFVRRNEALILKNAMNRYLAEKPEEPLLVMGDFNDTIRSRALQTVLGPKDASVRIFDLWLTDYFGDWWTHFYIPDKSYERIDYMFVSEPLFRRLVKEKSLVYRGNQTDPAQFNSYAASDHRALVAVFNVEPMKDKPTESKLPAQTKKP